MGIEQGGVETCAGGDDIETGDVPSPTEDDIAGGDVAAPAETAAERAHGQDTLAGLGETAIRPARLRTRGWDHVHNESVDRLLARAVLRRAG